MKHYFERLASAVNMQWTIETRELATGVVAFKMKCHILDSSALAPWMKALINNTEHVGIATAEAVLRFKQGLTEKLDDDLSIKLVPPDFEAAYRNMGPEAANLYFKLEDVRANAINAPDDWVVWTQQEAVYSRPDLSLV